MTMLLLALLLPGVARAETCNRNCETRYVDVFGCCPEAPTTPFPRPHVDLAFPTVLLDPAPAVGEAFWVARAEQSQALYQSAMAHNPSRFQDCGADCAVESIMWCEALLLANRLSGREWLKTAYKLPEGFKPGLDDDTCRRLAPEVVPNPGANGWRLPTAQEWALAVGGDPPVAPDERGGIAWYASNAEQQSHASCSRKPWSHGLCDIAGNVREWAWGPSGASVACGSGWATPGTLLVPLECEPLDPATRSADLGVRLVKDR